MCVCVCVVCVCVVCVCVCVCCVCVCVCVVCVCVCVCTCVYVCVCVCVCPQYMYRRTYMHALFANYVQMYVFVCTHTYAHTILLDEVKKVSSYQHTYYTVLICVYTWLL